MNLLLMHLFVGDARRLIEGATLGTPTWYRPVLVVPFTPPAGRGPASYLVAVLESPGPFVFVTSARPFEGARAPERFSTLAGRRVVGWGRVGSDRVIRIDAEPGSRDAPGILSLWLHLYGSRGSAILQRNDSRLETVGARRPEDWRPSERRTLVEINAAALATAMSLTTVDGAHSARAVVPGVDRELVDAFTVGEHDLDAARLIAFRDALLAGSASFDLATTGKAGNAVAIPPGTTHGEPGVGVLLGPFDSALPACQALGDAILAEAKSQIVAGLVQPIRRRLASHTKLLAHLQADLAASQGHDRLRREAETLAAYQSTIRPGAASAELVDIYDHDSTVRIDLDPALPIQKQIEKRFKKATKLEKSAAHTRRRIELVTREIAELRAAVNLLESEESLATSLLHIDTLRERFAIEARRNTHSARAVAPERTIPAGKHFDLGGGWYALVGRNNRDNDDLTFHHAAPTDLWFHAQGIPGSHVVLKTSRPSGAAPARIIEVAASLAAHFSKARHSQLVSVIYTQRKYVRKFRGAKPGQVVCEREKMVMVEPSLPKNADN